MSETPCHHSNSRKFKCACGHTHVWPQDDTVIVCIWGLGSDFFCGRRHVRGAGYVGGMGWSRPKTRRPCEGVTPTAT